MAKLKKKKLSFSDKEKIAKQCVKQVETAFQFKQPRMEEILINEDLYHGQALPRLRGRFSVPLPTMGGYVDTLLSKTDEPPTIEYSNPDDKADAKVVELSNRVVRKETRRRAMRFNGKDRNQKKLAAFSGVGIGEFFTESDPKYRNHYEIIDHYDFGAEPKGGESLDNHKFLGRINLFKGEWELEEGAENGFYEEKQVLKLINSTSDDKKKKNKDLYKNKVERFSRYGLDIESHDFVGENVFNLTWWGTTYKGVRYLVTLDYETGTWIRIAPLSEFTESGLWPWDAWHTHPDEFNFWSKAPADDLRPVAIAIDILFNQALDNRQKRNFGMRAFDPAIFPNPEELEWRPDGLVEATTMGGIKQIGYGIYEFKTEEITGTVDMISFMDQYVGRKPGIDASSEGESEEKKVGIYYGDLQQQADRLGLYNKAYSDYHEAIGVRFLWGMKEHLDAETAMDMLGLAGVEAELDFTDEINPEWDVEVSGGQAEFRANEVKKQKREATLTNIIGNQALSARINPEWAIRNLLLNGEWSEDDIVEALDLSDTADTAMIGEAEAAMQKIIKGEKAAINRGATIAFVKHIFRFAQKTTFNKDPRKDIAMYEKLIAYARAHIGIAQQNSIMIASEIMMKNRLASVGMEEEDAEIAADGTPGGREVVRRTVPRDRPPVPNTEEGTASISQEISEELTP